MNPLETDGQRAEQTNRNVVFDDTSSLRVTTERAVGSRLEAERTSFNCASFFSKVSFKACNFFSNSKFLKLAFCCTS